MGLFILALIFLVYLLFEMRYTNSLEKLIVTMVKNIENLHTRIVELERKVHELHDSDGK